MKPSVSGFPGAASTVVIRPSVTDTVSEPRSSATENGQPVIGFEVFRTKGASELDVARGAREAVAALQAANPNGNLRQGIDNASPVEENFKGSMELRYEGACPAVRGGCHGLAGAAWFAAGLGRKIRVVHKCLYPLAGAERIENLSSAGQQRGDPARNRFSRQQPDSVRKNACPMILPPPEVG